MNTEDQIEEYCMAVAAGTEQSLPAVAAFADGTTLRAAGLAQLLVPVGFALHEELTTSVDLISLERHSTALLSDVTRLGDDWVVAAHVEPLTEPWGSITACANFDGEWIFERLDRFEGVGISNAFPYLRAISQQMPALHSDSPEEAWALLEFQSLTKGYSVQRAPAGQ